MIINRQNARRMAVYFFFDKHGDVDGYVPYFLEDLKKNVEEILIVCNGKLTEEGKTTLEKYGNVMVRENEGLDVWAYKEGMASYGWEKLSQYDEVILLNSTIMGPLYPLAETFKKMDQKDLDFWGITEFFQFDGDPFGTCTYGYIPDHIQSHFIACRSSLVNSEAFHKYWDEMPKIRDYNDSVGIHETAFTKHFADLGFQWALSVDMEDLREYNGNPIMMCPKKLVQERRCPIFKRRSFFHTITDYLRNTTGEQTSELYEYIRYHTDYDVNMIWDTILKNYNQYDIVKDLNLVYVLPTNIEDEKRTEKQLEEFKVALIMHLYFEDLLDESYYYVSSMPPQSDIYITTDSEEKRQAILEKFKDLPCNKLEVRLVKNRGRDVSALMVGTKDIVMDYDLVCFAHDKKTGQVTPGTVGASFGYKCFENTLSNQAYVSNVINTFIENPRLGLLSPPEPNHGDFFPTIGMEWGANYEVTKQLADDLGLTVPISGDKPPIAPFGSMFWFRPKAMKPLYDKDWEYEDFPEEPLGFDGTISHAIERIRPYIVQQSGYYPAIGMTDKFAAIEYNNLRFYVRCYNQVLLNKGIGPYQDEMTMRMSDYLNAQMSTKFLIKLTIKRILRKILPWSVYDAGGKVKRKIRGQEEA